MQHHTDFLQASNTSLECRENLQYEAHDAFANPAWNKRLQFSFTTDAKLAPVKLEAISHIQSEFERFLESPL